MHYAIVHASHPLPTCIPTTTCGPRTSHENRQEGGVAGGGGRGQEEEGET